MKFSLSKIAAIRVPFSLTLATLFGGLSFILVVSVMLIQLSATTALTRNMFGAMSDLTLQSIQQEISEQFENVERNTADFLSLIESKKSLSSLQWKDMHETINGLLIGLPQVLNITYFDNKGMIYTVTQSNFSTYKDNWKSHRKSIALWDRITHNKTKTLIWLKPTYVSVFKKTLITLVAPVWRDGKLKGLFLVGIPLTRLQNYVQEMAHRQHYDTYKAKIFILYGKEGLVAYSGRFKQGIPLLTEEHPLYSIKNTQDDVLPAFWKSQHKAANIISNMTTGKDIRISVSGKNYIAIFSHTQKFGPKSLTLGLYLPRSVFLNNLKGILKAIIAGIVAVIIGILIAIYFGRRLSLPIRKMALVAHQIEQFKLDEITSLKRSRIKEIDETSIAFNNMVQGLKWFQTYLPKKLVRTLIDGNITPDMSPRYRNVTIMFTDLVGFSSLAEKMTALETASFLNDHFKIINSAVESTKGTVDKYIGDAVMAFWSAPIKQENHADLAVETAYKIAQAIKEDNLKRQQKGLHPIKVRIGIHSGEVVVGNIGAPGRINYTMVGDTVNIAQRLEQLGSQWFPQEDDSIILLSDSVISYLSKPIKDKLETAIQFLEKTQVKGRDKTISIFQLLSQKVKGYF